MSSNLLSLREKWTQLYHTTLPQLAKSRDPAQPHWPVFLDHCFARIILDNAIGVTQPWTAIVKAPAVRNMSEVHLCAAIELGEAIVSGRADLVELDRESLSLRGKRAKSVGKVRGEEVVEEHGTDVKMEIAERAEKRRKAVAGDDELSSPQKKLKVAKKKEMKADVTTTGTISKYFLPIPTTKSEKTGDASVTSTDIDDKTQTNEPTSSITITPEIMGDRTCPDEAEATVEKGLELIIAAKDMTPFRREVLSLLCTIPRGQWTTYAAMARHVNIVRLNTQTKPPASRSTTVTTKASSSTVSSKTCARAIGNAMRNNPFAPLVPCHRVLAADGRIGGFGGHWGEEGKFAAEKKRLLREEGVRFDGAGKAVGRPWEGWVV